MSLMINLPPGNWPEWLAAVGTVGALAAALAQIEVARRRLRTDRKEQLARERRAQAELVSAWIGDVRTSNDFDMKIDGQKLLTNPLSAGLAA